MTSQEDEALGLIANEENEPPLPAASFSLGKAEHFSKEKDPGIKKVPDLLCCYYHFVKSF